jgi:D-arabinose 1-dehydrogenase-like Zn-dependent alcohol dehydrogenase
VADVLSGGKQVPLPLGLCILNSLKVVGSDSIAAAELSHLFDFLTEANLRPHIDRVMPLENAMDAHVLLESSSAPTAGRVVLQVSQNAWI